MRLSLATSWRVDVWHLWTLLFLLSATCRAEARDAPRVMIAAAPPAVADLSAFLRAELAAIGIEVVLETPGQADQRVDALVRLQDSPRQVTLWIGTSMRTYAADAQSDEALAHQVAEVLRAELLIKPPRPPPQPSKMPPPPQPSKVPPAAIVRPPPVSQPPAQPELPARGAIAVGPAMTISPGPLAVLGHFDIDLRVYVWRGMRVNTFGHFPLSAHVTNDTRGDVVTSAGMAGLGLGYDLAGGDPLRIAPSLGVAWHWIHTTGRANPPYQSTTDSAHVAYVFAALDADYAITSWLSVTAGFRVGILAPEPRLVLAGEDIGGHGRPLLQLFAGAALPIRGTDF